MNISIEPIPCFVKESFLYDGDVRKKNFIKAEIIGVATYSGQPLTFHVLVDGQYLFSDMPITAVVAFEEPHANYDLKTLAQKNCETLEINSFILHTFVGKKVSVLLKIETGNVMTRVEWENATYVMSIDFHTGNELYHFVTLVNGQFALVPNHKINWSKKHELSDYKKNHTIWTI